jgi:YebC/PmpR family DNA-binding regulatory protein
MTDNRNRTAGEIRHIFSKNNGNMGETGCVGWMFQKKGVMTVDQEALQLSVDDLMMLALEQGAEDIVSEEEDLLIYTEPEAFQEVKEGLEKAGVVFQDAEVTMVPENTVEVTDPEQAKFLLRLMDYLEDHDDIQNTYTNFDISEDVLEGLS